MALMRKRGLGPTQQKVLDALRACSDGALRREVVEMTGLKREQVISALRGLLNREAVYKTRPPSAHKTAPFVWRACA